jgi:hypothetical protein
MAVVKASYTKVRARAKQNIRYITHRRDRDDHTITRELFGYDGTLTKDQAYTLIDEARVGTVFFRMIISPAPKREDRLRDLNLTDITIDTMLALEERIGKQVAFVATIHDDHSPHRHVHALVLVHRSRLTKEHFQALRERATEQALSQRRLRDRVQGRDLGKYRSRTSSRMSLRTRHTEARGTSRSIRPFQGYTCFLCGFHQALPSSNFGYRCPTCGLKLRRDQGYGRDQSRRRQRGFGLELSLSP